MIIKILGGGCANCEKLLNNTKEALSQVGKEATIEKIEDFGKIMAYGVMKTPALVIDEEVKVSGRVATVEDIKKFL